MKTLALEEYGQGSAPEMANLKRLRQTWHRDGGMFDIFVIKTSNRRLSQKITRRNNTNPEIRDIYTPCQRPRLQRKIKGKEKQRSDPRAEKTDCKNGRNEADKNAFEG